MKANNLRRYIYGILIGMIGEYLYRVGFDIIPLVLLAILLAYAGFDIMTEKNKQN